MGAARLLPADHHLGAAGPAHRLLPVAVAVLAGALARRAAFVLDTDARHELGQRRAAGQRGAEEQRVLGSDRGPSSAPAGPRRRTPADRPRRGASRGGSCRPAFGRSAARRRAPAPAGWASPRRTPPRDPAPQVGAHGRAYPGGQRDRHRRQQQIQNSERVMGDAAMARAGIAGGHPRHQQRLSSRARAPHARCPGQTGPRGRAASWSPRFPAPARTPPRPSRGRRRPWWSAPAVVIASPSPPNAAPAVRWPASSPRSRSARTVRECPPGSAPPSVCTYPRRAPGAACANAHATGASWPCSASTADCPAQRKAQTTRPRRA